jgi:hypothetical protein
MADVSTRLAATGSTTCLHRLNYVAKAVDLIEASFGPMNCNGSDLHRCLWLVVMVDNPLKLGYVSNLYPLN